MEVFVTFYNYFIEATKLFNKVNFPFNFDRNFISPVLKHDCIMDIASFNTNNFYHKITNFVAELHGIIKISNTFVLLNTFYWTQIFSQNDKISKRIIKISNIDEHI